MKKQKQRNNIEKVTVLFGYGLFALFLVSLIFTTLVPWVSTLFNPMARHFNIIIFTVSLIAGSILPTLLSYFIGDRATRSKSKLTHHFNGILYAIAAYWISLNISYFGFNMLDGLRSAIPELWVGLVYNGFQIATTIMIMGIVAFTYTRPHKNKLSIAEHKPYQTVLFGAVIIPLAFAIANTYDPNILLMNLFLYIGIPITLVAISYGALLKLPLSKLTRLTLSVVSMSLAVISAYTLSAFISYYVTMYSNFMLFPIIASLLVMSVYLTLLRRS